MGMACLGLAILLGDSLCPATYKTLLLSCSPRSGHPLLPGVGLALPDARSMLKDSLYYPLCVRQDWLKNAPSTRHTPTSGGSTMPYKVSGLRSWNINAEDFEAMVQFYRDILGAEETGRHQVAGAHVERLKLGSTGLGLFDATAGGASPHLRF
jgi:hypothetical protein